jgi:hypothetical protein
VTSPTAFGQHRPDVTLEEVLAFPCVRRSQRDSSETRRPEHRSAKTAVARLSRAVQTCRAFRHVPHGWEAPRSVNRSTAGTTASFEHLLVPEWFD